jgi:flagellar biosynthesis component FlhA
MGSSGEFEVGNMGLFFEKASSQSKKQRLVINTFIVLIVLDIIINLLLDWYWFSVISFCLYIVFIILFVREGLKKKNNNG